MIFLLYNNRLWPKTWEIRDWKSKHPTSFQNTEQVHPHLCNITAQRHFDDSYLLTPEPRGGSGRIILQIP